VTKPLPGQLRAGAHSDYGSLTILATENRPGGLQARNAAGEWVGAPAMDRACSFDKKDVRLPEFRLEVWQGW
jgi:isopenicillin N synthase-like dioxygenase